MRNEEIKLELKSLTEKWQGKPEPPFMTKEYIERRFDRMKYIRLRKQLNVKKPEQKDLVAEAEEIFGTKAV